MKTIVRTFGLFLTGFLALLAPAALAQNAPQEVLPVTTATSVTVVDAVTTAKLMQQSGVVLLDVRTPAEYATGHIQGAQNLDFRAPDFVQQIAQLDHTKTYVLYCASGNRSNQAVMLMQEEGFPKVVNAGAFKTLKENGLKTE
jgi:phage shock protein E